MKKTKIEWCDSTWNPVTGCLHECQYCYARRMARRFSGTRTIGNGTGWIGEHYRTGSGKTYKIVWLKEPPKNARGKANPYPFDFMPTFHEYRLDEPKKWKKPQAIFVCSMADLFGDWVPEEMIQAVFDACNGAPQHRYLFLTKNPQRYGELARKGTLPKRDNFWYGSTLDSAKAKRYPGRLHDNTFISIEPLTEYMNAGLGSFGSDQWVIIGAETGNRKGKAVPRKEWVENICDAAGMTQMAVFMKDSLVPVVGEENMRREFPWIDASGDA